MLPAVPQPQLAPQHDSTPSTGQGGAKKKNKKKKSAAAKANAAQPAGPASPTEASAPAPAAEPDLQNGVGHDNGETADEPADDTPVMAETVPEHIDTPATPTKTTANGNGHSQASSVANGHSIPLRSKKETEDSRESTTVEEPRHGRNGDLSTAATSTPISTAQPTSGAGVMAQDEDARRSEVDQLRQQVADLEASQEALKEETDQLRQDLEESEAGREQAETQYQNLLGRVEKIKETLGDRLKRDKQELEEAKDRIEELEAQNEALRQSSADTAATASALESQVQRLQRELDDVENEHEREHTAMRGRAQLSQQNWQREKEDLERQMKLLQEELGDTRNSMSEWEVVAMEERSLRASLAASVADLKEQLANALEQYEQAVLERDSQSQAVDSLQRALHEIQEARRHELREMVSDFETRLGEAEKRAQKAEADSATAVDEAAALKKELERTSPFEREVKEKNLLIGKLRHESIVLNDHLTRALRYIKKNKPEENVDKQVVTNLLLQFLALDRSDPKKFQVLQVIAGTLQWTEEQKEKAGLARPGTSAGSLRLPSSPFGRTPSTPALNTDFFSDTASTGGRETLSELWTVFLERSVDEATSVSSNPSSRKGSTSAGEKAAGV